MPETHSTPPLFPWTCISLRPEGQHHAFEYASTLLNTKFIACSPIRLQPLAADKAIGAACACDIVIATSPAAIKFAAKSSAFSIQENTHWYGLGPSTAAAMKKLGIAQIRYAAQGQSSEALLALPELLDLKSQSVGLLTAPGGRGLIGHVLEQRGARLQLAEVYERVILPIPQNDIDTLVQMTTPVAIFCSSYEVFRALWQALKQSEQERLQTYDWVLSSERLRELLATHGIASALVCHSAVPEMMFKTLLNDVKSEHLR
jgi:uroporphyrinogen-III synthase